MKVSIVGSRTLDLNQVAIPLLKEMQRLPDCTVLVRGPISGELNEFEQLTIALAQRLDLPFEVCRSTGSGRAGVYERDIEMVERSDAVIAFFDTEHTMLGGTGHVVEKAIDKEVPTYVYQVDADGYKWFGGLEPPDILPEWDSNSPTRQSESLVGG